MYTVVIFLSYKFLEKRGSDTNSYAPGFHLFLFISIYNAQTTGLLWDFFGTVFSKKMTQNRSIKVTLMQLALIVNLILLKSKYRAS